MNFEQEVEIKTIYFMYIYTNFRITLDKQNIANFYPTHLISIQVYFISLSFKKYALLIDLGFFFNSCVFSSMEYLLALVNQEE